LGQNHGLERICEMRMIFIKSGILKAEGKIFNTYKKEQNANNYRVASFHMRGYP
jgi:hypothetical protein